MSEDTRVATPDALSVASGTIGELPSTNITCPVGVPPIVLETVAVNVTDWPPMEGFNEEVTVDVVGLTFTTSEIALDVLTAKIESPPYCAVIECVPTTNADVFKVASALEFNVLVPTIVPLSRNVTVPVGVPLVKLFTIAVKVTDAPTKTGLRPVATVVVEGTPQFASRLATSMEPSPVTSS